MRHVLPFLILLLPLSAKTSDPNFGFLCEQLLRRPPSLIDYSAHFTESFRRAIPLENLKAIFANLAGEIGECRSFRTTRLNPRQFEIALQGAAGPEAVFTATLDPQSMLLSGLQLKSVHDPSVRIQSWRDVEDVLSRLDTEGRVSATLMTADGALRLSHRGDEVLAIGSTFKLYILGALEQSIARGAHRWDETMAVKEEFKSLGQGGMNDWPAGKRASLFDYAASMISISDNTATDHLLALLGRENVEAMLAPMGNAHQTAFLPFLSTLEMFKLKWAIPPAQTQAYLAQDVTTRRATLSGLARVPRAQVGTNGVSSDEPTLIDRLEWFATTTENCKAMFSLASRNSAPVRTILSKNVPILAPAGAPGNHWSYAGYKGGSEPGVLSMTFLLESKTGRRACLSMSWNNTRRNVSLNRLMDLVGKILSFAETRIP